MRLSSTAVTHAHGRVHYCDDSGDLSLMPGWRDEIHVFDNDSLAVVVVNVVDCAIQADVHYHAYMGKLIILSSITVTVVGVVPKYKIAYLRIDSSVDKSLILEELIDACHAVARVFIEVAG